MDIVIVNKETKAIVGSYQDSAPNQAKFGGPNGDSSLTQHVAVPNGMDPMFVSCDENYTITEDTEAKDEAKWNEIRGKRNQMLTACDWTQVADAPLTQNEKDQWVAYRQALRDLPQTYANWEDVVWPDEPSAE
jgi:hypothetical protein